jgi:hypothetical protein
MFLALGEMTGRKIDQQDLTRGLRADGLGTIIGGIFNTFPYTSFSQNVGLVGVTGIRSRWVTAAVSATATASVDAVGTVGTHPIAAGLKVLILLYYWEGYQDYQLSPLVLLVGVLWYSSPGSVFMRPPRRPCRPARRSP